MAKITLDEAIRLLGFVIIVLCLLGLFLISLASPLLWLVTYFVGVALIVASWLRPSSKKREE